MIAFTDSAWTDGEERTYLMWDYIEVWGLYLTLRMEQGENTQAYGKGQIIRKLFTVYVI